LSTTIIAQHLSLSSMGHTAKISQLAKRLCLRSDRDPIAAWRRFRVGPTRDSCAATKPRILNPYSMPSWERLSQGGQGLAECFIDHQILLGYIQWHIMVGSVHELTQRFFPCRLWLLYWVCSGGLDRGQRWIEQRRRSKHISHLCMVHSPLAPDGHSKAHLLDKRLSKLFRDDYSSTMTSDGPACRAISRDTSRPSACGRTCKTSPASIPGGTMSLHIAMARS